MPAILRLGDPHLCPAFDGNKPHIGGAVGGPGAVGVFVEGRPVSLAGDTAGCQSPKQDRMTQGIEGVFVEGNLVADSESLTDHGGTLIPTQTAVRAG